MKILSYGHTDRGLVREKNEDFYYIDEDKLLFAVADGLGGLPRGAEASRLAIELFSNLVQDRGDSNGRYDIARAFEEINSRVYERGRTITAEIGMGTTLTTAHIVGDRMKIGHVGDTAILRFRSEDWDQLTIDHTMEQEIRAQLKPGEDAFIPDYFSHTLTRCIGQAERLAADVLEIEIQPGDRFLLCSDGVTKVIQSSELFHLIQSTTSPRSFVEGIITLANNRGSPDNVTAIAIFVD